MGNIPRRTRFSRAIGTLEDNNGNNSQFNKSRYVFFLKDEAPVIADNCCKVMKKTPAHAYERRTGKKPMIATMTEESRMRTQKWLHQGCNAFDAKHPASKPLSFWTEQDILHYIKANNIKLASVYGDVIIDHEKEGTAPGQLSLIPDEERPLKTSGVNRTGCMFCGFGCHLEKPGEGRFERMKTTHPKQYDYIMRPKEQGGLNYKAVIDWINENGNLHIRY